MPGETLVGGGAGARENLRDEQRVDIVDGVNVGSGDMPPIGAQAAQAGIHQAQDEAGFLAYGVRGHLAGANDVPRPESALG